VVVGNFQLEGWKNMDCLLYLTNRRIGGGGRKRWLEITWLRGDNLHGYSEKVRHVVKNVMHGMASRGNANELYA